MKLIIGLVIAVCVGIGCRWFGIPLPGPPAIMGAAMAVAMATGYTATDYWLTRKSPRYPTLINAEQLRTQLERAETDEANATIEGDHYAAGERR